MSDYLTPFKAPATGHDPLCPRNSPIDDYQRECSCGLIDLVRKDERHKVIIEFTSNNSDKGIYNTALDDALQALESFYHNPEDDWLEAIDNVFVEKIVNNVKILKIRSA